MKEFYSSFSIKGTVNVTVSAESKEDAYNKIMKCDFKEFELVDWEFEDEPYEDDIEPEDI